MPNGEGSLSSLRYQITCTQEGGKKLLNSTCQEKITSNFSKGKITSIFSKDRMGGWKRWSKPQVSPLREDSNIILSNTFIATEKRNICKFGANLVKKLCYLVERLYEVQNSTQVSLKTSDTGIFHSNMQDRRECLLTAFLLRSRLEGLP